MKVLVFDIGNVLVRWAPHEVIHSFFPDVNPETYFSKMKSIWIDWNLGKLNQSQVLQQYQALLNLSEEKVSQLIEKFKQHQQPLEGSIEMLSQFKALDIPLYSITDNIKEIMDYHRQYSEFPEYFNDIIVSAEVGFLKPDIRIYQYFLNKHQIEPQCAIFVDDVLKNVKGAQLAGMHAFQFTDMASCKNQLMKFLEI